MSDLIPDDQLEQLMETVPGWELESKCLVHTRVHTDFNHAVGFVNRVADLAEEANHHPDMDIRWNKVTLRLSTHSKGGLTEKDFDLARKINSASASD